MSEIDRIDSGERPNSAKITRAMTPILNVDNLQKHYGNLKAVDGITLKIQEGTCFGLLGPNGAGKTTTVEMLEGIISPTSGEILYHNEPIGTRFRDEVGIMFQNTALQEFITVAETLKLFQSLYSHSSPMEELIESCALGEFLHQDTRKISGGQRQRLLLAIALINDPNIIFLDEPTTGLDPQARRNLWTLLHKIKAKKKTLILTTHYMEEAYELCDEIAIMDHGRIIAQGTPRDLLAKHFNDAVLTLPLTAISSEYSEQENIAIHRLSDRIEIRTDDVDGTLQQLIAQGVKLAELEIRSPTLEDLFLELTGHNLRA